MCCGTVPFNPFPNKYSDSEKQYALVPTFSFHLMHNAKNLTEIFQASDGVRDRARKVVGIEIEDPQQFKATNRTWESAILRQAKVSTMESSIVTTRQAGNLPVRCRTIEDRLNENGQDH